MALPVVDLEGSPREQGRAHGEALRGRIAANVAIYYERLEREATLPRADARERAARYFNAIEEQSAPYAEAMRGVADGSGIGIGDIAMLNVRYELLYYQFGVGGANATSSVPDVDGCTAFALMPERTENGHLWIGQNWDWIPEVQGAVLRTVDPGGVRVTAFTEAGIVGGKIGMSSRGIGLCINGMTTTQDDWSTLRKPVHVRCYEILRAPDFDSAVRVVTGEKRACTTNFLIAAAPDSVAGLETAPEVCARQSPDASGKLVHTNNFLDPESAGVTEAPNPRRAYSVARCSRMNRLLDGVPARVSISDLQKMLADHDRWPYGICQHRAPDETREKHYTTVTSVIMDLDSTTMMLTDGPPCEAAWQRV